MKTIIIGGGIQGLACAYSLAKRGIGPITLLEANRIGYGASGRSGGGIREQFRNEPNIELAKRAKWLYERLTAELDYHILFYHGGYMYLNYTESQAAQAEKDVALQRRLGVPTQLITPSQAMRIVPGLNLQGVKVVQYNPRDANVHHDAVMWAYFRKLRQMNVTIKQGIRVERLEKTGGRISGVVADKHTFTAEQVIVAAGAWTRKLLNSVGVRVPTEPWRREKLVAEPVRHFLDPLVVDRRLGISFHQAIRGEVLGSAHVPLLESNMNWNATRHSLENWCRGIYELFPPLRNAAVLRQWAGTRDFTPDGSAIFGPMCEVDGLWAICGQSGTGLMLAPAIAEAIACGFEGKDPGVDWELYSPRRFELGREMWERTPTG